MQIGSYVLTGYSSCLSCVTPANVVWSRGQQVPIGVHRKTSVHWVQAHLRLIISPLPAMKIPIMPLAWTHSDTQISGTLSGQTAASRLHERGISMKHWDADHNELIIVQGAVMIGDQSGGATTQPLIETPVCANLFLDTCRPVRITIYPRAHISHGTTCTPSRRVHRA